MLEEAFLHKEQLEREFIKTMNDPFFDFLHGPYFENKEIFNTNWSKHQFVSIDSTLNTVGFFEAQVNRISRYVDNLVIVNFKKGWNATFSSDLKKFIIMMFLRYNYRKIEFSVATNTRNEKIYDKFINHYGGRIIGFYKDHYLLQDGSLKDMKYYEIFRDNFIDKLKEKHPKYRI